MPPGFEEDNADSGGEVQAANTWIFHRNPEAIAPVRVQQIFGKTARLAAKDETVIRLKAPGGVKPLRLCREINEAGLRQGLVERIEMFVTRELHFRPVIETGASHGAIVHAKAGDPDDVKRHVGGGAQPRDVAGVRWNLGFDERN